MGRILLLCSNQRLRICAATPLDEQSYSDTKTWQDFFLDNACTSLLQIESLKSEAEQAGFTMSEEYQEEYDSTVASMADYALQSGFTDKDGNGDILAYVQDSYGPAATVESFEQYLYDSYYVTAYSDELYLDLSFTDEEIESYYDENSDMFTAYGIEKSELPNVNVRHILIQPETDDEGNISDEAWDTAKSEAEPNLGEWNAGDATEDSFGELANTYSVDSGSNTNGGLYEDVYPGQMVTEFNDWCFSADRKTGDTDIVKTDYGYHILYYVNATEDYYWKMTARASCTTRNIRSCSARSQAGILRPPQMHFSFPLRTPLRPSSRKPPAPHPPKLSPLRLRLKITVQMPTPALPPIPRLSPQRTLPQTLAAAPLWADRTSTAQHTI